MDSAPRPVVPGVGVSDILVGLMGVVKRRTSSYE
jgi:hypothetical protein